MTVPVPRWDTPLTNAAGRPSPEWYLYLKTRGEAQTATAEAERPEYKLVGPLSIVVSGLLQNGLASLALKNDALSPDSRACYGTDDDGIKGWHLIADALDVTADLTKSVDGTTNVATFGLADLADSGTGTLLKITRDAKGRVEGTEAATAADLPYDNTTSGLAATDVQAAIDELEEMVGGGGGVEFDPSTTSTFFDDFMGKPPAATAVDSGTSQDWVSPSIGSGGTITSVDGGNTSPGVWRLASGTTSGGVTAITRGEVNNVTIGGGEINQRFRVRLPTLSNGTNRYAMSIGLRDVWGGAANARLEILYTDNINGGAFLIRAYNGTTTTDANGSTAPVANTFYRLRLQVNAAGTEAKLYVNGALEATLSSGLPSTAMRGGIMVAKSAGTTAGVLDADYYKADFAFTTPR